MKQLELLLTRQQDVSLFANARLDFLVFDEAHTFTGAQGAETACLIRRLRAFCGREAQDTVCVATSATIVDRENPDAARHSPPGFFGVAPANVVTVGEAYERHIWEGARVLPPTPTKDPAALLNESVKAVEANDEGAAVRRAYRQLAGADLQDGPWPEALGVALSQNELVFRLTETLAEPHPLGDLPADLRSKVGRAVTEAEILCWLTFGAAARTAGRPLLRPVVHAFVRGISGVVVSFEDDEPGPKLWLAAEDEIGMTS